MRSIKNNTSGAGLTFKKCKAQKSISLINRPTLISDSSWAVFLPPPEKSGEEQGKRNPCPPCHPTATKKYALREVRGMTKTHHPEEKPLFLPVGGHGSSERSLRWVTEPGINNPSPGNLLPPEASFARGPLPNEKWGPLAPKLLSFDITRHLGLKHIFQRKREQDGDGSFYPQIWLSSKRERQQEEKEDEKATLECRES